MSVPHVVCASILAAILLCACGSERPPPGGTSVGNPGKTWVQLGRTVDLDVEQASLTEVRIDALGCDSVLVPLFSGDRDLLDLEHLAVPAGDYCALVVSTGALEIDGTVALEEIVPFSVTLAPFPTLTLWSEAPVVVDETDYILEIAEPEWLSLEDLNEGEGGFVVNSESEQAPALSLAVLTTTRWYEDDGDGILDEDERANGSIASSFGGPPAQSGAAGDTGADRSVALEGCSNCSSGGALGSARGWLPLLAALWVARRVQRGYRTS